MLRESAVSDCQDRSGGQQYCQEVRGNRQNARLHKVFDRGRRGPYLGRSGQLLLSHSESATPTRSQDIAVPASVAHLPIYAFSQVERLIAAAYREGQRMLGEGSA